MGGANPIQTQVFNAVFKTDDNVMLAAHGEVAVVDWGLAKEVGDADDHDAATEVDAAGAAVEYVPRPCASNDFAADCGNWAIACFVASSVAVRSGNACSVAVRSGNCCDPELRSVAAAASLYPPACMVMQQPGSTMARDEV